MYKKLREIPALSYFFILALIFNFISKVQANTVVTTWQNNCTAAYSLTYDDNRRDQVYIAAPAMTSRGLKGTFNVIPNSSWWTSYYSILSVLPRDGHELSSHTMNHLRCQIVPPEQDPTNIYFHSADELIQDCVNIKAIFKPLEGREVASIAYPGGVITYQTRDIMRPYFLSGRLSLSGINVNPPSPPDMLYLKPCYVGAGDSNMWWNYDYAYNQLTTYMNSALSAGGWVLEEYHDIQPPGYSSLNLQAFYDHFDDLVEKVQTGQLWEATQGNIARYIYSRNSAVITVLSDDVNVIELNVDDGRPNDIFDVPLTLLTEIPNDWGTRVTIHHNGQLVDHHLLYQNDKTFLLYSVIADGNLVQIKPELTIIYPNGGEYLPIGTTHTVKWNPTTLAGSSIDLEYSDSNGLTWSTIATIPNTGTYEWLIPDTESEQCLLKISSVDNPGINDVSDGVFTIFECQLSLKADVNGDCYINFTDFAILASEWLACGNPYDESCTSSN